MTIRFNRGNDLFHGFVRSDPGCVSGRKLVLKKVKRGRDRAVGHDTSNGSGEWSIREPNANGTYYAIAKPMSFFTSDGDEVDCLKGHSKRKSV